MEETKRDISTDVSVTAGYNLSKEEILSKIEAILDGNDETRKRALLSLLSKKSTIRLYLPDVFTMEDIRQLCDELKRKKNRNPSIMVRKSDKKIKEYQEQACKEEKKNKQLILYGDETNNQYLDECTKTNEFCNLFSEEGTSEKFVWLKTGRLLFLFLREFYRDCTYETADTLKIKTPQIFKNVKGKDIKYTNISIKKDFKSMIEQSEIEEIVKSHQNK